MSTTVAGQKLTGYMTDAYTHYIGHDGDTNTDLFLYSSAAGDYIRLHAGSNGSYLEAVGAGEYLKLSSDSSYVMLESGPGEHMYFDWGGTLNFRDEDNSNNVVMTIDSATGNIQTDGDLLVDGTNIGITADPDLLLLASGQLTINGNLATTGDSYFGGNVGIGTTAIPHGAVGGGIFAIEGVNANTATGPHIQVTTASNNYPLFQMLNWSHDNIYLSFDSYFDGAWKSSDAGSNFQICKLGDQLVFNYESGIAAGSAATFATGFFMDNAGDVIFNGTITLGDDTSGDSPLIEWTSSNSSCHWFMGWNTNIMRIYHTYAGSRTFSILGTDGSGIANVTIDGTLDIGTMVENKSSYSYMVMDGTRVKYNAGCPFIYTLKDGKYVVNNLAFHQMIPGDMSEQFSEINADKCNDYTKMKIVAKYDEIAYIDYFALMVRHTTGNITEHIEYPCTHDTMKERNEKYWTMKQGDEIEIYFANLNLPVADDIEIGIIVKGYTKVLNISTLKSVEKQEELDKDKEKEII